MWSPFASSRAVRILWAHFRRVPFPNCRGGVIGLAIASNPENDGRLSPWQEAVGPKRAGQRGRHQAILETTGTSHHAGWFRFRRRSGVGIQGRLTRVGGNVSPDSSRFQLVTSRYHGQSQPGMTLADRLPPDRHLLYLGRSPNRGIKMPRHHAHIHKRSGSAIDHLAAQAIRTRDHVERVFGSRHAARKVRAQDAAAAAVLQRCYSSWPNHFRGRCQPDRALLVTLTTGDV
jgi:hypothetical protein